MRKLVFTIMALFVLFTMLRAYEDTKTESSVQPVRKELTMDETLR